MAMDSCYQPVKEIDLQIVFKSTRFVFLDLNCVIVNRFFVLGGILRDG